MTVFAVIVSLGVAGGALAATEQFFGTKGTASDARVRIKHKDPKNVELIQWTFQKNSCGGSFLTFYHGRFRDLRVRDDRFKGVKKNYKVVGKFSRNASKMTVTYTHFGESPCKEDDVLVSSG